MTDEPLLRVTSLSKSYGGRIGCQDVSFDLWPGEVLAVVGESGSGKTTLLNCVSTRLLPTSGTVVYRMRDGAFHDLYRMSEAERRFLMRTDWGFVHQNPADGLRMTVSAGANVGERLMAVGDRHYGNIRATALDWLSRVEIEQDRIDDQPRAFSGGMRQRLQIARNLVTGPRLVFMDEPTGGLDVSVQARLLDLLRGLVNDLGLAALVVTHDLAVARLLSQRIMVMKEGRVVETGLTDRVLDDPAGALHPASRLLDPAGLAMPTPLVVSDVSKSFTMHLRDGLVLAGAVERVVLADAGECAVLGGPSGAGKSSVLKMLYGNYACDAGQIIVSHHGRLVDLATAGPRTVLAVRRDTIGYVSQFLRVVPRVSALDVAAEPLVALGEAAETARDKARELLSRLNLPERLWSLPPATFSGGEQQRVNIARGFITDHPILLLDEPTASLDKANRDVVVDMIRAKKAKGVAMLGIFHDADVRGEIADRVIDVTEFAPRQAA